MVIFCSMQIKKSFFLKIFFVFLFFLIPSFVYASEPMFSFYPGEGDAYDSGDGFTVDILIDSGGEELVEARAVITFDPSMLKVTEAKRNNSLFLTWPSDESTIDNENGVVMLTGFTQSGEGTLYSTDGDPDVFARLTFEILEEGETSLEWEYSGENESFKSVLMKDGSPPQNVLNSKPDSATFNLITGESVTAPDTGLDPESTQILAGAGLALLGSFLLIFKPGSTKKSGTVVIYEK